MSLILEALFIVVALGALEVYLDRKRTRHDAEWRRQELELLEEIAVSLSLKENDAADKH